MDQKPASAKNQTIPESGLPSPREIDSVSLLQGDKEILIRHAGEVYRLRLTKNDKLILQK